MSGERFRSGSCEGERCSMCNAPADAKVEETIFHDDPMPHRHPYTAYVCAAHFDAIMSPRRGSSQQDEERTEREVVAGECIVDAELLESFYPSDVLHQGVAKRLRKVASLLRSSGQPSTLDATNNQEE